MSQTLRPTSQLANSNWTTGLGGTTNLHLTIDETSPSDSDFIESGAINGATVRFGLTSGTDPVSSSSHVLRTRWQFNSGTDSFNLTINLKDGGGAGTTRATKTLLIDIGTVGWTTDEWTLSGAQADAITDYSTLKVEFVAAAPNSDEIVDISWVELSIPDAPTGCPRQSAHFSRNIWSN